MAFSEVFRIINKTTGIMVYSILQDIIASIGLLFAIVGFLQVRRLKKKI